MNGNLFLNFQLVTVSNLMSISNPRFNTSSRMICRIFSVCLLPNSEVGYLVIVMSFDSELNG